MSRTASLVRVALSVALVGAAAAPLSAQAYNYPQFQPPRPAAVREFNFGLAGAGDAGTSLLAQWREPISPRAHFSVDLGFASPKDASAFFLGGGFAHELARASATMPLDLLLTVGAGFARISPDGPAESFSFVRVPVGLSVGHRFPIQGSPGMSITPYAHPRIGYQRISSDGNSDSETAVDFEIGGDFTFTPQLALRAAARLGGGDYLNDDAFGISLAWTPARR